MCGILGIFGNNLPSQNKIIHSLEKLNHRGPDNSEFKFIDENCILAHTRLSILDLNKRSNQPFNYKNYTLTYNGEIFNFLELKKELKSLGYNFFTSSDTEVVLYSYIEWGKRCVDRFNGMWSFAVYDEVNHSIFLSRDRYGIKPLRYVFTNNTLYFASESKAIINLLDFDILPNKNKIVNFIKESEGNFNRETWFENIFNLPPGHNLFVSDGKINIKKYYDSIQNDCSSKFQILLEDSIKKRMISDVPIGFTLSSGIDSSSIVKYSSFFSDDINCFTAAFDNSESEHEIAERFCNDNKFNLTVSKNQFEQEKSIEKLVYHLESGHGSPAVFPLFSLYKKIKERKIKVVLEGQGADELLGGYESANYVALMLHYLINFKFKMFLNLLFNKNNEYSYKEAFIKFLRPTLGSFWKDMIFKLSNFNVLHSKFTFSDREKRRYSITNSYFNNFLNRQHSETLTNLLHYGDAISMAFSIESRLPFMDYRLIHTAANLNIDQKMGLYRGKIVGKKILRKSVEKVIPSYILENRKKGFPTPVDQIIGTSWAKDILNNLYFLKKYKIINHDFDFRRVKNKNLLYRILISEYWFKCFFNHA